MYVRVLVPVDASPAANRGLEEALRLAKLTGAHVRLLHVIDVMRHANGFETHAAYTDHLLPALRAVGKQILLRARALAARRGIAVQMEMKEMTSPHLAYAVVDVARSWKADLIVIGTHGRYGVDRLFLGSDAEQIARRAPVPVLLVREPRTVAEQTQSVRGEAAGE